MLILGWVDGLVHALGPCGSLQQTLLWGREFLPLLLQPPWVFSIRGLRLYSPMLESWVAWSVSIPPIPPGLSMHKCGATGSASCCTACPIRSTIRHLAGPPAATLLWVLSIPLPVSIPPTSLDECSLSPWLLDFHAVRFSVSSGCFLFLSCPSFGYARRRSVSTYVSILAGSL